MNVYKEQAIINWVANNFEVHISIAIVAPSNFSILSFPVRSNPHLKVLKTTFDKFFLNFTAKVFIAFMKGFLAFTISFNTLPSI